MNSFRVLNGKYAISDVLIGKGAFGEVYLGKDDKQEVAIKYEKSFKKEKTLVNEIGILKELWSKKGSRNVGIPNLYETITDENGSYMVLELLGQSLSEKQKVYKFSNKQIGEMAIDLLNTIQFIHECGYVYVDIKPENFLFGRTEETKEKLYIVDYGCSQSYLDSKGNHKKYNENSCYAKGSIYYASVWNHYGIEYARRDDLIALGFVLLRLVKGELPWENLKIKIYTPHSYELAVLDMKNHIEDYKWNRDKFFEEFPKFLETYMLYCWNLPFEKTPDYDYLRSILLIFDN